MNDILTEDDGFVHGWAYHSGVPHEDGFVRTTCWKKFKFTLYNIAIGNTRKVTCPECLSS